MFQKVKPLILLPALGPIATPQGPETTPEPQTAKRPMNEEAEEHDRFVKGKNESTKSPLV
eukprot:2298301-Pyramimonas_sp.AAC.1